jgi:hypothetical protein
VHKADQIRCIGVSFETINLKIIMNTEIKEKYICTDCGKDATLAYCAKTITKGKRKGQEVASWNGLVKPYERLCMLCGRKRGLNFIDSFFKK